MESIRIQSSRLLPTSRVVYQPINHRHLWSNLRSYPPSLYLDRRLFVVYCLNITQFRLMGNPRELADVADKLNPGTVYRGLVCLQRRLTSIS